jgi:hypothetical protein
MTGHFRFGIIICLILVFGVFFAGCSNESASTAAVTTEPTTVAPVAKYSAGDIVAKTDSGGEQQLYVIMRYDSSADEYERAWIYKNADGTWGHFYDSKTDRSPRKIVEKVYPAKVAHVDISAVPVATRTLATPVPTTYVGDAPVVSSISPASAAKDATVTVTITGKNFQTGAIPKLVYPGNAPVTGSAVSVAPTSITCTFVLSGLEKGSANIVVLNPDGRSDILQNGFVIGDAAPIVTGITPAAAELNDVDASYTIYGQNFKSAVKISFIKGSTEILCINPSYFDSTKVTCGPIFFDPKKGATEGLWDVKVVNIEGSQSSTLMQKFKVTNTTPSST